MPETDGELRGGDRAERVRALGAASGSAPGEKWQPQLHGDSTGGKALR